MATMTETPEATSTYAASHEHDYHAEANVLSGHLKRPIEEKIEPQAPVSLNDRRGGHFTRQVEDFSIEGLISFTRGESRVSGARSGKDKNWVTLATSVMEGLNVFEVVAAGRVVSQVSTNHAYYEGDVPQGYVPRVTFLGTQFENLRVAGIPIKVTLNLGICGNLPADGKTYLGDSTFLGRVKDQTATIRSKDGLPKELKAQYDEKLGRLTTLIRACEAGSQSDHEPITCSLVQSIEVDIPGVDEIPGIKVYGNVLVIEDFGSVTLGELVVGERFDPLYTRYDPYFELTGIHANLGCIGDGTAKVAMVAANGHTKP
jgi:hypothetical protein